MGRNPGAADSVTATLDRLTQVLNKEEDYGPSCEVFGLWAQKKTTAYRSDVPAYWYNMDLATHLTTCKTKYDQRVCPADESIVS